MQYDTLCGTFGGVLSALKPIVLSNFSDRIFHCYACHAGNLSALLPSARSRTGEALWHTYLSGCGTDVDASLAQLKAVCEAAERYSSCILLEHEYLVASANELGTAALDWHTFPSFSVEELELPNQQFRQFNPDDPIRWVEAVDLHSGKRRYVPTAMSHIYPRTWTTEQFWSPISTGTAVHSDPAIALVTAIAEVIERDSIALTWLLRRHLRRIRFDGCDLAHWPPAVRPLLEHRQEFMLFDGTTDFGLPTVYLRRRRPSHPHAANLVTCASSFSYADACLQAVREMATLSSILDTGQLQLVANADDCFGIEDGAVYMAQPERAHAFDFLDGRESVRFAELRAAQPLPEKCAAGGQLRWLKQRARTLGHQVLLLELTCDELKQVGLRSFRALIPGLMPMSTITTARYLGTPRLAQFHRHLQERGEVPSNAPLAINPFPQAFA